MTDFEPSLAQSQSFLPLQSSVVVQSSILLPKKRKKQKLPKEKSVLYGQLVRINSQSVQKKRQCVVKYLKKEGEHRQTSKIVSNVQREGHAIPILEVAVALSGYNHTFLQQLLDSKSIELKEKKQSQLYEINKCMQSDPILSLLSESEQLKRMPNQAKEPSFVDFKHISPKRKNELIDMQKGRLLKSKVKDHSSIEFPKQLSELKKDLLGLPYIKRYKKVLDLKKQYKQSLKNSNKKSSIQHISDLNDNKSFATISRHEGRRYQTQASLENSLIKAMQRRVKSIQLSTRDIELPSLENSSLKSSIAKNARNRTGEEVFQTIRNIEKSSYQSVRESNRSSENNPQNESQGDFCKKKPSKKGIIGQRSSCQYWPSYSKYSSFNNKYLVNDMQKIRTKVRSLTELSQIPSQQTLGMYYSLKNLQNNDLKKLQQQSFEEQKVFSNTKYQIKFKNIKQNYNKRLKQFLKDRKMRQFELQQGIFEQNSNLTLKQTKLNGKILQKIKLPELN